MTHYSAKIRFGWLAGAIILLFATGIPVAWGLEPDVEVYGEGACTENNIDVYLYADINTSNLLSFGIKLTYDAGALTVAGAEKNAQVWYMGGVSTKYQYRDPDLSIPGEVLIVGGKIDTADPLAGVSGQRILLGKISFARKDAQPVPSLGIGYGRGGSYDNFVKANGSVLDWESVSFGTVTVRERGDANGDGVINVNDIRQLKRIIGQSDLPCWVDCNGDGAVNVNDIRCLQRKI
ncbi:MAG: dockerin type I repeat-containing protein [Pseudomonadota bacterium]